MVRPLLLWPLNLPSIDRVKVAKYFQHLAQLFRGPFLRKVAYNSHHVELTERLELCGLAGLIKMRLSDIFESVYELLLEKYRCEYVFKNALTQAGMNCKDQAGEGYITDEFRVGRNRVDLAVFSNTSTAFEIKTEYDSTARVHSQTSEYAKVFDLVYVVTTPAFRPKVEAVIGPTIGLMELNSSGTLVKIRNSYSHARVTNLSTSFDCLRQAEMIWIAESISKKKVQVPRSKIYTECKRLFRTLLPFEGHEHVLSQLRSRRGAPATRALLGEVPTCLKHAVLTLRANNQEVEAIREQLKSVVAIEQETTRSRNRHANLLPISSRQTKRTDRVARTLCENR